MRKLIVVPFFDKCSPYKQKQNVEARKGRKKAAKELMKTHEIITKSICLEFIFSLVREKIVLFHKLMTTQENNIFLLFIFFKSIFCSFVKNLFFF
jgi:hypothetical protein